VWYSTGTPRCNFRALVLTMRVWVRVLATAIPSGRKAQSHQWIATYTLDHPLSLSRYVLFQSGQQERFWKLQFHHCSTTCSIKSAFSNKTSPSTSCTHFQHNSINLVPSLQALRAYKLPEEKKGHPFLFVQS
jgi:hypothetical protein